MLLLLLVSQLLTWSFVVVLSSLRLLLNVFAAIHIHTYIPVYHLYCHVNSISFINLVLPTILCPSIPNGHALEHDWRWWGTEQVKKIYSIHTIVVVFVIVAADFFLPLLFTSVLYSIAKTLLLLHLCMRVCVRI